MLLCRLLYQHLQLVHPQLECGFPDVYLTLVQTSGNTYEVHMDNDDLVSGFQFSIEDNPNNLVLSNIVATDRVPEDWAVSGNENQGMASMLGFSFGGTTIEAGSGPILEITVETPAEDFSTELSFYEAILSNPSATAYWTIAEGITFSSDFTPPGPEIVLTSEGGPFQVSLNWELNSFSNRDVIDLTLENVDLDAGTADVYMSNTEPVGGFQISFTGADITEASGGSSADAGFMVSSSSNMILGFSLSGATIPAGEGTLVSLTFDYDGDADICLETVVLSDSSGDPISVGVGECAGVAGGDLPGGGEQ